MTQTLEHEIESTQAAEPDSRPISEVAREFSDYNEFSYRPVPVIAVVGFVLTLLSSMALFVWLALPLCLIAFVISSLALFAIRREKTAYSGTWIAVAGIVLSATFFSFGLGYQVYTYKTEVPEGYERYDFLKDISEKGFVTVNGQSSLHPDVLDMEGKDIFLKGYIYQTGKMKGLGSFILVKDNQDCCFGASPALTDRVGVVMAPGKEIDYKAGKVAIAGKFRINDQFTNQDLEPLYVIDGEYFTTRISDF
ncbi:hypothetical protein [Thalassoglobus polymorphus]|uniref:DUF4190 domain-containing protein n=1 Tax=Thalassoglobus polymorphus TaxID=2527994 RepID=A0A517QM51_9PLAN|nr:hypothetical protein [Thalassoglobus polymorphus]QDT32710.1 hypothetical protein Mal48_19570 [Thalassoglobus polymorphus]